MQPYVSVYYESKCPDSRAFILHQLQPAIKLLHKRITLNLIPFGKARSINNGYDGFECQHGPAECLGNVVQECALDVIKERTDLEKTAYVACEMKSLAGAQGSLECVEKANIPSNSVIECLSSDKGTSLQLHSEYLTKIVSPQFVPTVTIDGMFNQQIQDSSQEDLIDTLCSILQETKECAQYHNLMAMKYIL
ncbi:gamma-interferon-inducible lysosomal thiol reductase-like isoform X2 [Achroia grisella]|uniref:gamma-interferon-inducible lysosomal thiol reductase-like isoform X2 n=1 Tax=Achroia grisella TaxID=688607 RepID=UPI0027D2944C|nr:gamma-interferon-inducible lysosomal thiol reductase-like isoform X2 [Achroia grisella]